ncbi:MAG: nucleotidyl transferase AbiEii/AbiGii toxin family protein [Candidatus Omnitrophica bacterium]|nr:nucleotidyl transferase AbiEii/AbiGii toxin family protein [Candidatus Omnitrophota bacterium]
MIEKRLIQQLAERYQTTADNVIREYFQHLFLAQLYQAKGSEGFLFKGGTALRIVWQSPRFSEDLDFTGVNLGLRGIEATMEDTLGKIEQSGIETRIDESKATTGGYLAIFDFRTGAYSSRIQIEVSLRKENKIRGAALAAATLIQSDFVPAFALIHLDEEILVGEKIRACLTRGKARDFYDLYFILRGRMAFQAVFTKNKALKAELINAVKKEGRDFRHELKQFLPVNQHLIIKGFPDALVREIERNLVGK